MPVITRRGFNIAVDERRAPALLRGVENPIYEKRTLDPGAVLEVKCLHKQITMLWFPEPLQGIKITQAYANTTETPTSLRIKDIIAIETRGSVLQVQNLKPSGGADPLTEFYVLGQNFVQVVRVLQEGMAESTQPKIYQFVR